jgi:ABC-type transporter Mla subunit MlaD
VRTAGRVAIVLVAFLAIAGAVALGIQRFTGSGTSGYLVRAVFDNSSFVIPGEEVKVAGVTVGTIQAVELTPQNKAALVLQITDRQFAPFHTDAQCAIGLESLLGEQFVQCTPTQPRAAGVAPAPALPAIPSGPDKGQHLLPVQNTQTPVGLDLINNITRVPQQQRVRLIIAGLGAGLAGNGQALNQALMRADPALEQTDRVIAVLASQDHTLAQLTDESARVLAPLAAQRQHIGGFIQHAGAVAVASAQEGQAIQENFQDFPAFLRQLTPATARLTNLAQQMTPSLQALLAQAPAINASVHGLGPLAVSSIPAIKTLGNLAQRGESVFPRVYPLAQQLLALTGPLLPLATDIAAVAQSFDNAGGIENVMRFIYYYAGAVNGEDALGHYVRSLVQISQCTPRTSQTIPSCAATFASTTLAARDTASRARAARDRNTRDGHKHHRHASTSKPHSAATSSTASTGTAAPQGALTTTGTASSMTALLHYLLAP